MIQKIKTDITTTSTIVEVTPDDLIVIARRMHLEATKALPGEEVLVPITDRITLKYNPDVTTAMFASRNSHTKSLPGTEVASRMDCTVKDMVNNEDAAPQSATH